MQLIPHLKAFRIHSGLTYVFLSLWAVLYGAFIAETIDLVKPLLLFILLFYSIRIAFFINNLLPVTIGNIIGGALLVAAIYWFIFLRPKRH